MLILVGTPKKVQWLLLQRTLRFSEWKDNEFLKVPSKTSWTQTSVSLALRAPVFLFCSSVKMALALWILCLSLPCRVLERPISLPVLAHLALASQEFFTFLCCSTAFCFCPWWTLSALLFDASDQGCVPSSVQFGLVVHRMGGASLLLSSVTSAPSW